MKNNIKKLLKEKSISILSLSQQIELTYSNTHALVNRCDLGTTPLETLRKVANVLEIEIHDLYEEESDENNKSN